MVMIMMGRVASGKSTLARSLARELSWEIFSSDRIRKQLADIPLYERPSPAARRQLYSKTMTEKTYDVLRTNAVGQVKRQRSLILDATFSNRQHRDQLIRQLGCGNIEETNATHVRASRIEKSALQATRSSRTGMLTRQQVWSAAVTRH